MKFARRGKRTLPVEVRNLSSRGFSLALGDRELSVSFKDFPWFRALTNAELARVERPSVEHVRWPHLDIDLEVDAIEHPDRYPMVERRLRGTASQVAERLRTGAYATTPRPAARKKRTKVGPR